MRGKLLEGLRLLEVLFLSVLRQDLRQVARQSQPKLGMPTAEFLGLAGFIHWYHDMQELLYHHSRMGVGADAWDTCATGS